MSLEYPGPGCALWFGGETLSDLKSYTHGFINGVERAGFSLENDMLFFQWLKDNGHFPVHGWCKKIAEEFGDGEPSYLRFFELLHEYLFVEPPDWFIEFNKAPQPSPFFNGLGNRRSDDIRNNEHINMLSIT